MLRIYNTLNRKVEEFKPLQPPKVGYYSCGPTVYDYAHIGHARTYVFADILHRVLELNGFKVKRVMNITDVGHLTSDSDTGEDKMEKGARRDKKSVWDIAKFYTDDFFDMMDKLNIIKPQTICKATDYVDSMIRIIEVLEGKGYTYKISDGIYFDTAKLPNYGKLTGQSFASLQKTLRAGARVEMVEGKKQPTDFALWKFSYPKGRSFDSASDEAAKKRQMEWSSPWGKGFPGWHIECSTMSIKHLGDSFDIHSGGVDHISTHHTNEIAQSEAATGKQFVKYWLHGEHLLVEGNKMSKSLGNFYRLQDIVDKGYYPMALRYLFLTSSYRQQLNFTWKSMDAAATAYENLTTIVSELKNSAHTGKRINLSDEKLEKIDSFRQRFKSAVNNDLNTAEGLSVLWEAIKSNIPAEDKYDLLLFFDEVLGLNISKMIIEEKEIPSEIVALVNKRQILRQQKKFKEADNLRKNIEEAGYTVLDSPRGPKIKPIR